MKVIYMQAHALPLYTIIENQKKLLPLRETAFRNHLVIKTVKISFEKNS